MADEVETDNLYELLPEGCIPVGHAVAIKALGPDGKVRLRFVWSGVPPWEALGMLTSFCDDLRDAMRTAATDVEEDED